MSLTFFDLSSESSGVSYWLKSQGGRYSSAYFPCKKGTDKQIAFSGAYKAGGCFAFFRIGASGSEFQSFRATAEKNIQSDAEHKFIWVDDRESEWEYSYISEKNGKVGSDINIDIEGYLLSCIRDEETISLTQNEDMVQFSKALKGKLYAPGEEGYTNINLTGIVFSDLSSAGSLSLSIPVGSREVMKALGVRLNYVYKSETESRILSMYPFADNAISFFLSGALQPFTPATASLTMDKYLEPWLETAFSFADGSPVCLKAGDVRLGFEKTMSEDGEDILYLCLKGKTAAGTRLESEGKNTFLHDTCSPNRLSMLLDINGGQSLSVMDQNLYLHFVSKPAYISVENGVTEWDGRYTVPWVAVEQDSSIPPEYYQHSQGMSVYDAGQTSNKYEGYPESELLFSSADENAFPLLPNTIISPDDDNGVTLAKNLDVAALSFMRGQVFKCIGVTPELRGRKSRSGALCVTGEYAYVPGTTQNTEREPAELKWLGFSDENGTAANGEIPSMAFTNVRGELKNVFLKGETFTVLADADIVKGCVGIPYRLTEANMTQIQKCNDVTSISKSKLKAYFDKNKSLYTRQFTDEAEFEQVLYNADNEIDARAVFAIEKICAEFYVRQGEFMFSLAPFLWAENGTILICKFRKGISLEELAKDTSQWAFPSAAGNLRTAKERILRAIDNARMDQNAGKVTGHQSEYSGLLDIAGDPDFTGILALQCPCVNTELPSSLADYGDVFSLSDLRAEFVRIRCSNAKKTEDEGVRFYTDTESLMCCKSLDSGTPAEGFYCSPTELFFRLENDRITLKNIHAEMYLDKLFAVSANISSGGNVIKLCGTCQKQGGVLRYELEPLDNAVYSLKGSALDSVEISRISLSQTRTDKADKSVYTLSGCLRFRYQKEFDGYSYGYTGLDDDYKSFLTFSGLVFSDVTDRETGKRTVKRDRSALRIKTGSAKPRKNAFADRFPVRLKNFLFYENTKIRPSDLSYTAIQSPVEQGELSDTWFGLLWETELGSCGLSALKGVRLELLMAWGPGESGKMSEYSEYVGMRLIAPDGKAYSMEFTLFDALKLKFKTIELKYDKTPDGKKNYTLLLRNFALQMFALSLPGGTNTLAIYADPDKGAKSKKLGWYSAYFK